MSKSQTNPLAIIGAVFIGANFLALVARLAGPLGILVVIAIGYGVYRRRSTPDRSNTSGNPL